MTLTFLMNTPPTAIPFGASALVALAQATQDPHHRPGGAPEQQKGTVIRAHRHLYRARSDDRKEAAEELLVSGMDAAVPATMLTGGL